MPDAEDLLIALRHATRRAILKLLVQQDHEALSPTYLADQFELPLSNVSYHVRVLDKHGAVELADTEPVRGSVKHFYRVTPTVRETPWVRETLGLNPPE